MRRLGKEESHSERESNAMQNALILAAHDHSLTGACLGAFIGAIAGAGIAAFMKEPPVPAMILLGLLGAVFGSVS